MPDLEPWPLYLVVFKVACRYERSSKERLADRLMLCYLLEFLRLTNFCQATPMIRRKIQVIVSSLFDSLPRFQGFKIC